MKRIAKSLLVLIIALCVALSVGCNFITFPDDLTNGNNNNGYTSDELLDGLWGRDPWANEVGELANVNGLTFTSGTHAEYSDFSDAYSDLARACVAIRLRASETATSATYGSGTIVNIDHEGKSDNEYYILTCHHVIDAGGYIEVFVPDENGRNYTDDNYDKNYAFTGEINNLDTSDDMDIDNGEYGVVSLVGGDLVSDVAVLKLTVKNDANLDIDTVNFPRAGYEPKVLEEVFAIGNPTGTLPGTPSVGTISYFNRGVSLSEIGNMSLTQINVDIYPGSSGGALFNKYGEIIGITNAGNTEDPGINYAIPYDIDSEGFDNGFIDVAKQLIATKILYPKTYGFVPGHNVRLGLTVSSGTGKVVKVAGVEKNSLAEKVGFKVGDIITKVGNTKITESADLGKAIANGTYGKPLVFYVTRGNMSGTIEVPLVQFHFCDTGAYAEQPTQPAE